jgi:phosphatidylglycerophosphatase C
MVLAAFDFDGTLTTKDTLFDFIIFCFGRQQLFKGLIKLFPILFLHKIKIVSNQVAKERLFSHFFAGMPASDYYNLCDRYNAEIDKILNPAAMDQLKMHQQAHCTTIVISASIEDWIKPWAAKNNIDQVIGTQIEIVNDKLTGRFKSKNCYGVEKVNRLLAAFPNRSDYELYAYGDSNGDRELLALADFSFYKRF